MGQVIELARFRVDADSETEFLAARPAMVEAVTARVPGLLDISLVRLNDGSWIDVVTWTSREAAEQGAKIAAALPEAREWLKHVAEDVSMDLGQVIDKAASPRSTEASAA